MNQNLIQMGVPEVLRRAATEIETRGLHQGSAIHKASGAVDVWGAIALACGAKPGEITDHVKDALDYIPSANVGKALTTYDYLGARVGLDASRWGDIAGEGAVLKALRHLSYETNFASFGDDIEPLSATRPTVD
jgi:hypothetical protein